ncbi:hypothetical protein [uncultured Cellulomonas sp.]|uniref:hypothetical protein n=1 Tax=uncultured Cellulomonas sp. TaxID=189682 RepID=UPI0028EC2E84|nr:hypothetical protein [uncultured Cellulomonas sp.]
MALGTSRWVVAGIAAGLVLVAGTVAASLAVLRLLDTPVADDATTEACWNDLPPTPSCLPLEGLTGAMWAVDPDQVVVADCDRLRKSEYPEAEDAYVCGWLDLTADVVISRFTTTDAALQFWREATVSEGEPEVPPDEGSPDSDAHTTEFLGSFAGYKGADASFTVHCYQDVPYCVEIYALTETALETADERLTWLTTADVDRYQSLRADRAGGA